MGDVDTTERTCRICGCTDSHACMVSGVGCHWIGPNLCSNCGDDPHKPEPVQVAHEPVGGGYDNSETGPIPGAIPDPAASLQEGLLDEMIDAPKLEDMDEMEREVLGPDDMVAVKFGDLAELEANLRLSQEGISEAMGDLVKILNALQINITDEMQVTPSMAVAQFVLPKIAELMGVNKLVIATNASLDAALKKGAKTMDMGGGVKAVQVGRRLPPNFMKPG